MTDQYLYNQIGALIEANQVVNLNNVPIIRNNVCKVLKVLDGDTIIVAALCRDLAISFTVRLLGINCPETRTKNSDEKAAGNHSKTILTELLLKANITHVELSSRDPYGRYVGIIYADGVNINDYMVNNKYAAKYSGGKVRGTDYDLTNFNYN